MKHKNIIVGSSVIAILALVGLSMGLAEGASTGTPSGTFNMAVGTHVILTCVNGLNNSPATATSETVNCAANSPTTTTTTTQPPPTTTTTVPPTTTTTTTPPVGGTCTKPIATLTVATDTVNTDPPPAAQNWWVSNDAWNGSHGPQTVAVCSQSSWTASSNQKDIGGQVETYPDTEYDVGGRSTVQFGVDSTKPISGFNSITSTFSEAFPAVGSWDAGYDLWVGTTSVVTSGQPAEATPFDTEIMVWNQWSGSQAFWANCANGAGGCPAGGNAQAVTLNGVAYHYFDNSGELMFFRDTQTASGSVDVLAAFNWLVAHPAADPHATDSANGPRFDEPVVASNIPTELEYGVEVASTSGTEVFPLTGLTFSLS